MSRRIPAAGPVGKGGGWIVTYSDMVTLLMAFFICIIAFAWKEEENYVTGKSSLPDGSVVWRSRIGPAQVGESGVEMAPIYQDPSAETSARIVQALEAAPARVTDNFTIRLPLSLLFEAGYQLSPSGVYLLHALADHFRDLPYDLQFQVNREDEMRQAIGLCGFLASQERYEPARLAVGGRPQGDEDGFVWLVLFRQS